MATAFKPFAPPRFKWLFILLLTLGIGFRFFNLEHKVYWGDEVFTSMRISGYTAAEVTQQVFNGQVIGAAELQKYQHPNAEKDWSDTLQALTGSPEHTPLYFGLARLWMQGVEPPESTVPERFQQEVQQSVWWIRSLSALISLLVFPAVYWLCLELFGAPLVGWVAIALIAVSPFHVLYAQEARAYSLYILMTVLSSAALLRALRRQTLESWATYAIGATLGLYTFLFSGLVLVGHGIYVAAIAGQRQFRLLVAHCCASLLALALFSPWLWVIWTHTETLRSNVAHLTQDQPALVQIWLLNLSRIFYDVNQGPSWINPLTYAVVGLAIYAVYFLCRQAPRRSWLFVLTLIGVTGSALVLSDLLLGGQRSAIARYPIPCYLGIQIAVAYCIAQQLRQASANRRQTYWRHGAALLALLGIVSCLVSSQQRIWWNKGPFKTQQNPEIAVLINQAARPLVISDASVERVFSLAYLLQPQVQLQLLAGPTQPVIPGGFSEVFLYQPSDGLRSQLQQGQGYSIQETPKSWLWRLANSEASAG